MISERIGSIMREVPGAAQMYLHDAYFHQRVNGLDEQYEVILAALGETWYHPSLHPSAVGERYVRLMLVRYVQQARTDQSRQEAQVYLLKTQPPDLTKIAESVGVMDSTSQKTETKDT